MKEKKSLLHRCCGQRMSKEKFISPLDRIYNNVEYSCENCGKVEGPFLEYKEFLLRSLDNVFSFAEKYLKVLIK